MNDVFARLIPSPATWDDPLFRTDARGVRWGESRMILRRRWWRWGGQMLLLVIIGVVLFFGEQWLERAVSTYRRPFYEWFINTLGSFVVLALMGSVALNLLLDFVGISAGLNTISGDFTFGRVDLIRLTLLRPTHIVASKHAVAQMRVLRMTFRIMWLRVWLVVLGGIAMLIALFDSLARGYESLPDLLTTVSVVGVGALTVGTFLIEPYWRMKAITAMGVMQSARNHSGVGATLNAGFALVGFWAGQIAVVFLLAFLLQITVSFYVPDQWFIIGMMYVYWAIITAAIRYFYASIERNSLYQTAYRLATLDN